VQATHIYEHKARRTPAGQPYILTEGNRSKIGTLQPNRADQTTITIAQWLHHLKKIQQK
jgi:hypothetical protein